MGNGESGDLDPQLGPAALVLQEVIDRFERPD